MVDEKLFSVKIATVGQHMSRQTVHSGFAMNVIHPIVRVPEEPRVQVEPELEFIVSRYSALERLEMAQKFERWAKQLRLQLTVCVGVDVMPPKVRRIPEPRRHVKLQNN